MTQIEAPPLAAAHGERTAVTQDMHSFLEEYEREFPEEVVHVEEPIQTEWQLTALCRQLEKAQKFPVVICHNVLVDGQPAEMPLVTFLMASRLRLARLLGTDVRSAGRVCYERVQQRLAPVVVSRGEAPVKQVVETGPGLDVRRLPAPLHHAMDPGRYITEGLFLTYNRESRLDNSAMHRGWISGRDEIRVLLGPSTHNWHNFREYEAAGEDMPVAYWVGHHPLALLGGATHVSRDESHFEAAGGTLGAPLRLVPSETLGEDFLVPADAEVVIEGFLQKGVRKPEGPFGEYTRHVGPQRWGPVMKVTAVTRRKHAYWDDVMVGHTHWISSLTTEGAVMRAILRAVPGVKAVHVPMSGTGVAHVYVQIKKTVEGQGKIAGTAALVSSFGLKHAFVFDEDIDIFSDKDVLLAMSTRFQAERGLVVLPSVTGSPLDPSALGDNLCSKAVFDCTKPLGQPFAERLSIPADVEALLEPERFIRADQLARIPVEPWG